MSQNATNGSLQGLITELNAVTAEVRQTFGPLSSEQLNWKPGAERWSIAQCLDHLITANKSYFPTFETILSGEKKTTFWEKLPVLPKFFGSQLIKHLSPDSQKKLKAPQVFRPATSAIDGQIVESFTHQQENLSRLMRATEGMHLHKIIITSPSIKYITYSLLDAFTIIVVHEQRHLAQARRVLEVKGFPRQVHK